MFVFAFLLLAMIAAILLGLGRLAIKELRRAPQQTTFQQRYLSDSHERQCWQQFAAALSAGTLPELRNSLKQ